MVQMTVLKVDISCLKCKKKLLKAVSGLKGNITMSLLNLVFPQGVDKVEADAAKGTLTVTGDCDPYEIIVRSRKVNFVEVVSIGPSPAPPKPADKKPEQQKPDEKKPDQKPQHICMPYGYAIESVCDEPNPYCSIM